MKLFGWRPVNLAALLSIFAILLITILVIFVSVILYSDYRFNESTLKRSEAILSSGLLKGSMPLAVAANDRDLIKSIVHEHLRFEEIHAVEIRSATGETLYREEKQTLANLSVMAKTFNIVSPYESYTLDTFDNSGALDGKKLGSVIIYFTTERLHDTLRAQLYFTATTIFSAIVLCLTLIYFFNRYIAKRLSRVINLIMAIKNGQNIESYKKPIAINELAVIDAALRDMVHTIYERDRELKISLGHALDAKNHAQEAEQFKDDFIRAISHDIKTPVGVVVNLLNLINDEANLRKIDPALLQKITACYRSAKLLADVTGELFDLERFESGELNNMPENISADDLFAKIASLYEQKFIDRGLIFTLENNNFSGGEASPNIMIDESKVILIIENIIDNALKFTSKGWVCLTWKIDNELLYITIRDSGIGIPEDKIPCIFEKHRQLGDLATNRHAGRGLGLFYVKKLIDCLEGTLSVSSKIGIGTLFTLAIPFQEIKSIAASPEKKLATEIRILIIDDDEMTCFTLAEMLEKIGFTSSYECIPEIGFSRLIKEAPDLVFIDYHMPNTSGDQVAKRAQKILPPQASFYVCITAESNPANLDMLGDIFQVILRKPFAFEELKKIMNLVTASKNIAEAAFSNMADDT